MFNKLIAIGNVGRDPEMRFTPSGKPVTSFSLATNRVFTASDGERRKETEWFNIVAWNRLAETCNQFLTKGKQVYVEGEMRTRTWEGQDGQKRSRVEVYANRVIFLDRRAVTALPEGEAAEFEEAQETIEP
ncbi:single-stranded DNA-binding protein, partial [Dehalococcoidia bacterium]|nr:single-stranded DNA-binding protein [Dehalococcoidia bacterium]